MFAKLGITDAFRWDHRVRLDQAVPKGYPPNVQWASSKERRIGKCVTNWPAWIFEELSIDTL